MYISVLYSIYVYKVNYIQNVEKSNKSQKAACFDFQKQKQCELGTIYIYIYCKYIVYIAYTNDETAEWNGWQ